jgi:pimeloyl-ACP methyl ester carboxylesterase
LTPSALTESTQPASRAATPAASGHADSDGVPIAWELFGEGEETLLFLPPWSIVHSRFWKQQVPYLSRQFRVLTFDPRGNGRSGRPGDSAASLL